MQVVQTIVQQHLAPRVETVNEIAIKSGIPTEHLDHFVRLSIIELQSLHEGNFVRYRLRPSEFTTWAALSWTDENHQKPL